MDESPRRDWRQSLVLLAVGTELVVFTVVGTLGGLWLDDRWQTKPWGMVIGLGLGATAGFVHLFRVARRFF